MTGPPVPQATVDAAIAGFYDDASNGVHARMRAALEAAAPSLRAQGAAAERQRLGAALARHQHKMTDSRGDCCAGCLSDWPCPDLIREEPGHA